MNNLFRPLLLTLLAIVLTVSISAQQSAQPKDRYVVVLSLDGFRWDYLNNAHTPTLDSLARVGVYSQIYPCFPSNTFPNHFSMATGLHPDEHGLVNNSFVDKTTGVRFTMSSLGPDTPPDFLSGEPIWNCVERQGLRSAVVMWVGSMTPVGGKLPSSSIAYDGNMSWRERADRVVAQLCKPTDSVPNLIMWYIEEPDAVAHHEGPTSRKTFRKVEELDQLLAYFFAETRKSGLHDKVNFIITSDHGMAELSKKRYINTYKHLDASRIEYCTTGVPLSIEPHADYVEEAYAILSTLPHMSVYRRHEIPAKYHYGSNINRIPALIVVPETGWSVDFRKEDKTPMAGAHGYDPFDSQLQMIFFGSGPAFKVNTVAPSFQNLNLHNIIARTLGVEPAPNSGDTTIFKHLFQNK